MTKITKVKKIIIGTLISIGTLGGLATYAIANGSGKPCGMPGNFIVKRISSKLDLNEDQKHNLESLKTTIMEQMQAHKDQHPREKIKELLSTPTLDQEKVLALLEERRGKMQEFAPTVIAAIATFTDSLSTEQRAEMLTMMDKFGKHRGGPFGKAFGSFGRHQQDDSAE